MKHQILLKTPGKSWDDGLFLGNGRIGASVQGQIVDEVLTLNEETMWYGTAIDRESPDAKKNIAEIRRLLMAGEVEKATFLAKASITSCPKYLAPYVPGGYLRLSFFGQDGEVQDYARRLDIDRALAEVCYVVDGARMKREYFVSQKKNVLAIRLSGEKKITALINLNRRPYEEETGRTTDGMVYLKGQCGAGGVRYYAASCAAAEGGKAEVIGDYLALTEVESAVIYTSMATDYNGRENYEQEVQDTLLQAMECGFDALLEEHEETFGRLYNRCSLSLGEEMSDLPTDQLIEECRTSGTHIQEIGETLFALGRYLLISSSYQCQLPATLQGIWNGSFTPAWESKYTININTQMNYWPAEVTNLSECHLPLFDLIERMEVRGRKTAREVYGCDGFVAHHNTNIWADTAPEGIFNSSPIWPMGGAWLSLHLYEHFLYTEDEDFLRSRALPVLESAVRFFLDYLMQDKDGTLLTGPSLSPENSYCSRTGQIGALCMAPTMDSQILRELFRDYLDSCRHLGENRPWISAAENVLEHLPKTEISADGRIREWHEEYQEVEPGHRHVSHLFGLHPGNQMNDNEPELREAARKTLAYRLQNGGGHTGWSCAWILCFYARLKEGENVQRYLHKLISNSMQENLLDSHPPFQIDGNFGVTAAIAEALVQSHNPYVELLPALPNDWKEGHLIGAKLRGNISLDLYWKEGKFERAILTAAKDRNLRVRYGETETTLVLKAGEPLILTADCF
ncbi:MAG: glycosyl hydrolase family 95 catalytic domain-containing protein [Candidatus Merdivicinus sp.]